MPNIRTVAAPSLKAEPGSTRISVYEVNVLSCLQEWWNWGIQEGPAFCRERSCSICGAPGLQEFFGDCKIQAKDCKIWVKACKIWLVATSRKLQGSATQDTTYLKERWSVLSENAGSKDRGANPCCQFSHSEDKEKYSVRLFHDFFAHSKISWGEAQSKGFCPASASLQLVDGVWSTAGLVSGLWPEWNFSLHV